MKNYTITVNGNAYDVTVEEKGEGVAENIITQAPIKQAAPVKVATEVKAASTGSGSIKIETGAAGKVFKVEAKVGQAVKRGDAIIILEAMKMEIPVVAQEDGVVTSIEVAVGDAVDSGAVIATLN